LDLTTRLEGPAPDITHSLDTPPPADAARWASRICIVPNARMLDRAGAAAAAVYLDFMSAAIGAARAAGLEAVILLHETNDRPLAERLAAAVGDPVPIIDEPALIARGMIGACRAVVGSRYHALL